MTKLLLILMVVGLWSGCGKEIEIHTERYDNGKMKKEYQSYTRGINYRPIKHGWYKSYYESGKVKEEGNYVDGKVEGEWVKYYESGKVKEEGNYVDKKTEGKWVWYYESGKVFWERNYVDGKREGKSVGYWENGEIRDEDIWKDGECVEMCEGDE